MSLPELERLQRVVDALGDAVQVERLATVFDGDVPHDVLGLRLGSAEADAPVFALVAGIHGLERIGTEVVLAFLDTLASLLAWDDMLAAGLTRVRIVAVPLCNPVGVARRTRCNGRGVDLMRNAPDHPRARGTPWVGGQRVSPRLPWFRGWPEQGMEPEAAGLCAFVRAHVLSAPTALLVDVHSGFGTVDRLWFPWARTRRPIPHLPEVAALAELVDRALPNHVYRIEPQARNYTAVGDLWDHLYDEQLVGAPERVFLPLTLELGSWLWVKKNPRQLLHAVGGFHPITPHRVRRTLRRHLPLFDVLLRAAASPAAWVDRDVDVRERRRAAAFARWY